MRPRDRVVRSHLRPTAANTFPMKRKYGRCRNCDESGCSTQVRTPRSKQMNARMQKRVFMMLASRTP